ncbi:WhiB family transcriptional regulator [Micromonospora tulbaghiae]|uniref:WhiB family transcriptional regulator n=1 Tax=Micromonospora tulbaghiae TaxID=479978 RepID=UPI0033EA4D05
MSRRSAHNLSNGTSADRGADWRHDAVCRDMDGELFFPIGVSGPAQMQTEQAKNICHTCPVEAACLAWAIESGQEFGVAGGMSEDERRALVRRHGRHAAARLVANRAAAEVPA